MWHTWPNRAQPGLHTEPLDVAIGRLLASYRPGASIMVIDGSDTTNTHTQNLGFTVHHNVRKASAKKARKGPSTHVIGNASS